ncbi:VOC family protein [Psychrobacillus sp. FSL K6-4046]|uniref:VOC family protein n=1 Tax=Psychrobacillus sp. FSL K6-4046 TaxID=2921550 RepID=UPI003159EEB6
MKFHQKPSTYVELVELKVTDLEQSLKFYEEVIGFKVLDRQASKIWLTADGKTALLSIEQPENVVLKQPKTTGLYHFALLLPSREDLGAVLRFFAESGIRIGAGDHLVSEALYLNDPDGNGIEIYSDRPESDWNWEKDSVAMDTLAIDAQAILAAGANTEWNGLPKGTVMGHIHLQVADIEEAREFYELMGFEVVTPYPGALFMSTGKYHHHIGLNTWAGAGAQPASENMTGLEAFNIIYPSIEERETAVKNLREQNISVLEENEIFYTKDPSENKIKMAVK